MLWDKIQDVQATLRLSVELAAISYLLSLVSREFGSGNETTT